MLHEVTKLLHYAGAEDVEYFRMGTSGRKLQSVAGAQLHRSFNNWRMITFLQVALVLKLGPSSLLHKV